MKPTFLALMEEEDADAYTAEKEAAAQAEQERKQTEEDAKKAAEEAAASGSEQTEWQQSYEVSHADILRRAGRAGRVWLLAAAFTPL